MIGPKKKLWGAWCKDHPIPGWVQDTNCIFSNLYAQEKFFHNTAKDLLNYMVKKHGPHYLLKQYKSE